MTETEINFYEIIAKCKEIFLNKMKDYGVSWRILRISSITDQIYIKAKRIRNIELSDKNKIGDSIEDEYKGIINYSIMGLIQLEKGYNESNVEDDNSEIEKLYEKIVENTKKLMQNKNHDYGEAWRNMRISSMIDLILMKLLRVKKIENNNGKTIISEGIDANYQDIINYSIFALILLKESKISKY